MQKNSGQEESNRMSLVPWNPFKEMENVRRQIGNMFDQLPRYSVVKNSYPKINIRQTENEIILDAEIHGIPKENIDVSIDENRVHIRGQTNRSREFKDKTTFRSERYYGSFSRIVALPSGAEADKARIENKDGVLSIIIPKKVPARKGVE